MYSSKKYRSKLRMKEEIMNPSADYHKYLYKFERNTPYSYQPYENESFEKSKTDLTATMTNTNTNTNTNTTTLITVPPEDPSSQQQPNTNAVAEPNFNIIYPCFIVDPLSLIVKLAIVGKKPVRTKISIMNHSIVIHEPGIFQGIVRYYNNSTKQDLHHLQTPIEVACMQYIIQTTYASHRELVVSLFHNAVVGLEKLAETYRDDSLVVLCINHYINIIHNAISINSMIMNKEHTSHEKYYNDMFVEKMCKIWSVEKIDIVLRLADCISKTKTSNIATSIRSLETFIESIDADVLRILRNM
jgi:hypothetical protein